MSVLRPQGPVAQGQLDLIKLSISIMIVVMVVVFGIAAYVLVKFRRKKGQDEIPEQVEGNHKLEIIWTAIPRSWYSCLQFLLFKRYLLTERTTGTIQMQLRWKLLLISSGGSLIIQTTA